MNTKLKIGLIFFLAIFGVLFLAKGSQAAVYRYCGASAKGSSDGTSWDNQWSCTGNSSIDTNMASLTSSQPAYLFIDGGNTSQTYTNTLAGGSWSASGASATNRIYIMPGYAAQQMGVPGTHTGHTGQVIFDGGGINGFLFHFSGSSHITVDGYSDPRPHGANTPRLILKNINGDSAANLRIADSSSDITVRNMDLSQTGNISGYLGDMIITYSGSVQTDILLENNYFHDCCKAGIEYAAIWTNKINNFRVRYNEFNNVARQNGEGVGDMTSVEPYSGYMDVSYNLIYNSGTAVRGYSAVRNNTIANCASAWYHSSTNSAYQSASKYFENNFVFNCDSDFSSYGSLDIGVANLMVRNNLFSAASYYFDLRPGGLLDTTISALNARSYADGNLDGNNASNYFVNYSGNNFRLSTNAANAINKGYEWSGAPSRDFLGNSIVGIRDIGAFEYGSGSPPPDTTPPAAPTNVRVS